MFHLTDSATADAFARLPRGLYLTDSALQSVIALTRGETWECINHALVKDALAFRIETLRQARIDSTVMETLIHKSWVSSLLGDAEQVLERLMIEASELGPQLQYLSSLGSNKTDYSDPQLQRRRETARALPHTHQ